MDLDAIKIPISATFVAPGREQAFDPAEDYNVYFLHALERGGLMNAIDVRAVGGRYEVVRGRRRLWGVQQLKRDEIFAHWSASGRTLR